MGAAFAVAGAGAAAHRRPRRLPAPPRLPCFVMGIGFGFVASPAVVAAQSSVVWQHRGVATGANMFARSVGSAVGIAVFGAIANSVVAARTGGSRPRPRAPADRRAGPRDPRGLPGLGPGLARAARRGHRSCPAASSRVPPARRVRPMKRTIYDEDHEAFRGSVREFLERSVIPHVDEHAASKALPREFWLEAGKQGFLGLEIPEEYGGSDGRRLPVQRGAHRGARQGQRRAVLVRGHPRRHRRAVPRRADHRGAARSAGCRASPPARSSPRSA